MAIPRTKKLLSRNAYKKYFSRYPGTITNLVGFTVTGNISNDEGPKKIFTTAALNSFASDPAKILIGQNFLNKTNYSSTNIKNLPNNKCITEETFSGTIVGVSDELHIDICHDDTKLYFLLIDHGNFDWDKTELSVVIKTAYSTETKTVTIPFVLANRNNPDTIYDNHVGKIENLNVSAITQIIIAGANIVRKTSTSTTISCPEIFIQWANDFPSNDDFLKVNNIDQKIIKDIPCDNYYPVKSIPSNPGGGNTGGGNTGGGTTDDRIFTSGKSISEIYGSSLSSYNGDSYCYYDSSERVVYACDEYGRNRTQIFTNGNGVQSADGDYHGYFSGTGYYELYIQARLQGAYTYITIVSATKK